MKLNTKDKNKIGIYVIRNTITNKVYVGKSINIYIRMKQHVTHLNTKSKDENIHLINSWHKYGKENFEYFVVEYFEDDLILAERELYWIDSYDSLNKDKGYNLRYDSSSGMIVHDETKEKLSKSMKNRWKDDKYKEKMSKQSSDFWKENPDIKEQMAIKVAYAKRKYRIGQFDKETDELIKIYEIKNDILIDYPDFYLQAIKGCCSGTKKSYKGFKWHYIDLNSEEIYRK